MGLDLSFDQNHKRAAKNRRENLTELKEKCFLNRFAFDQSLGLCIKVPSPLTDSFLAEGHVALPDWRQT